MIQEICRAKINLTLDILPDKRSDGYHEISTIMQTIKLADILELSEISSGIKFNMDASEIIGGEDIPTDEKNLVYRAAVAVSEFCGKNFGVSINLQKKIPTGAGLAGGSSDAAGVIRGMNRLFNLRLTNEELCKIAEKVGSDVPYCINGGTCLAEGRGEKLTRLPDLKNFSVVLVKPRGEISTAWAYKTFDELPEPEHLPTAEIVELLNGGEYETAFKKFANVFELVAVKKIPAIEKYKNKMIAAGAKVALMSGSGSSIFALTDKDNVEKIVSDIEGQGGQIFITETC